MEEKQLIFLNKIHHSKIWGSEDWVVSAHSKGDCIIANGKYTDKTLGWLWQKERALFGNFKGDRFPILTKIIDAKQDLSIQVHPGDDYAKERVNGELGKTECWYIIDCNPNSELILGHHAKSKEEMQYMIQWGQWEDLLRRIKIKPGDFFYIPAGTIHGIGKGTVILETQQSSDVTYRLYDYGRIENGRLRDLHVKESIEVTSIPHKDHITKGEIANLKNATKELLVKGRYFSVYKIKVDGKQQFKNDKPFLIVSVLKGRGKIEGIEIAAGNHFIIPCSYKTFQIDGDINIMVSSV